MQILVKIGIKLILNRKVYNNGSEIVTDIDSIFNEMTK